jgi:hypothetical protein
MSPTRKSTPTGTSGPSKEGLERFDDVVGDLGPVNMTPDPATLKDRPPATGADFKFVEDLLVRLAPPGEERT